MTLDGLKPGETALITGINYNDHTVRPITLGLLEGTFVKCITEHFETLEIEFHRQRMAVSKHTAKRYSCKKLNNQELWTWVRFPPAPPKELPPRLRACSLDASRAGQTGSFSDGADKDFDRALKV